MAKKVGKARIVVNLDTLPVIEAKPLYHESAIQQLRAARRLLDAAFNIASGDRIEASTTWFRAAAEELRGLDSLPPNVDAEAVESALLSASMGGPVCLIDAGAMRIGKYKIELRSGIHGLTWHGAAFDLCRVLGEACQAFGELKGQSVEATIQTAKAIDRWVRANRLDLKRITIETEHEHHRLAQDGDAGTWPTISQLLDSVDCKGGISSDTFGRIRKAAGINVPRGRAAAKYRYSPDNMDCIFLAVRDGDWDHRAEIMRAWAPFTRSHRP